MRNKLYLGFISSLSVILLFAGMAFAKTKQIDIIFPAKVGNSLKLQPGKYRINVVQNMNKPEVKFFNLQGHLVGQAPVKVVDEAQKNNRTQVDYDKLASNQEVLTQISPGGWRESLLFSHASARPKAATE